MSQDRAAQLVAEKFDPLAAVGGVRGIVESVLPPVAFIAAYSLTGALLPALVGSLVAVAALIVVRLVQRSTLVGALTGFGGVLIGLAWAWTSGEARDYFLWGLIVNALYLLGCLISLLVRRPVIGLVVAFVSQLPNWRTGPRYARFVAATWLWVGVFALRLAAQVPLYRAGDVEWLGALRIAMGVPLFALAAWITWLTVRTKTPPVPSSE